MSDLIINGVDALEHGIRMGEGFLNELLCPAPMKEFITNESRLEHGKRVIYNEPRFDSRDLTLVFTIEGNTPQQYLVNLQYFNSILAKGKIEIKVPAISDEVFILTYQRSSGFGLNLERTFSKVSVKATANLQP